MRKSQTLWSGPTNQPNNLPIQENWICYEEKKENLTDYEHSCANRPKDDDEKKKMKNQKNIRTSTQNQENRNILVRVVLIIVGALGAMSKTLKLRLGELKIKKNISRPLQAR